MKLLTEEKVNLQGWSLFSNIEGSHAAIVKRDPLDGVIRGVRYQVFPVDDNNKIASHKFMFESWEYKARGPIEHVTFLSFNLHDRTRFDPKVAKYVTDLRILNKNSPSNEEIVLAALKCAASMIDHINFNENFDVHHMLNVYGLKSKGDVTSSGLAEEKKSTFFKPLPKQELTILLSVYDL